jgi:hypothetical protein
MFALQHTARRRRSLILVLPIVHSQPEQALRRMIHRPLASAPEYNVPQFMSRVRRNVEMVAAKQRCDYSACEREVGLHRGGPPGARARKDGHPGRRR